MNLPGRTWPLVSLLIAAVVAGGCAARRAGPAPGPAGGYYRTGYPARDVSGELERILNAVKRVQVTATYRTWRFDAADRISAAELRDPATYQRAREQYTSNQTKIGTGTVLRVRGREVTLITNQHVVRVPDTVIVYHRSAAGTGHPGERTVESVSIRTSHQYLVVGLPDNRGLRVLAADTAQDIAVVAVELLEDVPGAVAVLDLPRGDPARLGWGCFVYVLGYPGGFKMVTRGIVSDPNRGPDAAFLLDGLFNRGISGGLILAVRSDTDALEWVGIAATASALPEYVLLPEVRELDEEGLLVPYQGALYLERVSRLQYGITFAVPMAPIERFLRTAGVQPRREQ